MQIMSRMAALPEGCITYILSLSSPRDACAASLVSTTFKSAADSDVVWEKFLPSDYEQIVLGSLNLNDFSSKKELYFRLCTDPVLIDGGNKSFNLERETGKKCFMIGARALQIDWGENTEYWEWISRPDSRFAEIAEVIGVWWFNIHGTIETRMLSPNTTYGAYFVVKFAEYSFGLREPPTDASVEFVGGVGVASGTRTVYLEDPKDTQRPQASHPTREDQVPRARGDGWMEIEIGEFYNDNGEDGEVRMVLKEVAGHYKGGLIVQGIEIRPKPSNL